MLSIVPNKFVRKYMMITEITFDEILPVWRDRLWPGRVSKIETNSAMRVLSKEYDGESMHTKPTFFAFMVDGVIAGVNSGHMCKGNSYRSRGLYVDPTFRRQGIGEKLLLATIQQGKDEGAFFVWSYPKLSSWKTYKRAGFNLASAWELSEMDTNAYCILLLDSDNH
jgi:GNAT superfamily N-acetyltransferase